MDFKKYQSEKFLKNMKYILAFIILVITLFHYLTPTTYPSLHELYKVLYFIPILLAAFLYGYNGGLAVSIIISFLYFPHIMFQWGGSILMNLSRLLMIALYNVIGGLTGYLWQNEKKERERYQRISEQLKDSLERLENASEEVKSIESQLRTAERLSTLGELTASLAHEVRNPLGSIRGAAEILRDESKTESNKKFIDILLQETQRLEAVVGNYLSYAKPKKVEKAVINLYKIAESMIAILKPEARKRQITFDIVSDSQDVVISGQGELVSQALLNILINAVQASPNNGKITVTISQDKDIVAMECSDEGPGISEDDQKKIFDPFFTTKSEGTGLGLAITKRIIKEHGGDIFAKPKKDRGTIIRMEFPHGEKE